MKEQSGHMDGAGRRFGIVVARFNELVTRQLLAGARDALVRHGVGEDDIEVFWVPGAWEIPGLAGRLEATGRFDAIIALGAVIRGATPHFDFVAGEAARGLGMLASEARTPVIFGVLTTDTLEQALERAGTKAGNKGADSALAALEMADLYDRVAEAGEGD
jgi:6,7-dimethyl-8-ribityllumazine synthase